MADRKASQEPQALALGSADFWAAVQNGTDVQISVQQIYDFVRNGMVGANSGGVPTLDSEGKLDPSVIPALAINDTFVIGNQASMLALTAQRGDVAVRTDLSKSFVLKTDNAAVLANWQELLTPTDAVLSVAGLTGTISVASLKVALAMTIGDVAGLQAALDGKVSSNSDATLKTLAVTSNAAIGGTTGQFPVALTLKPSVDAGGSKRAALALDAWLLLQDTNGDGTKNFSIYNTVTGKNTLSFSVTDVGYFLNRPMFGTATPWDNLNLNPALYARLTGDTFTGQAAFKGGTGSIASRLADGSILSVVGAGGAGDAAAMTFNRPGQYATWFGLDADNEFKFGGWTESTATYRFWTSKNFNPANYAPLAGGATFTGRNIVARGNSIKFAGETNTDDAAGEIATRKHARGLNIVGSATEAGDTNRYITSYGNWLNNGSITATAGFTASGGDVRSHRGNATGYYFMGNADQAYVGHDGGNFVMSGPGTLFVGGSEVTRQNQNHTAAGYYFTGHSGSSVYADPGTDNVVIRHGNATVGWRYSQFRQDGWTVLARGLDIAETLTVGSGQTSSTITMADTDNGARQIHNNSGYIGFLGSDGAWKARVDDGGAFWTAQLGDLNTRIEQRADAIAVAYVNQRVYKGGDTMTGDLQIQKAYPGITYHYPGVRVWQSHVRENGWLYFYDQSGNAFNVAFNLDGGIWTRQLGDLNGRIEQRAADFANDRLATARNEYGQLTVRLAFAGDLPIEWNINGGLSEPYGGAVITSRATGRSGGGLTLITTQRWRYLQMRGYDGQWYTVGYV